jgi:DNA-3-methyladenine glycosylase
VRHPVRGDIVPVAFYDRDPLEVAPDLLGKVLVAGERAGRIVEAEAYRGDVDPGAHSYRGRTARNAVMFGPPGRLYVYFVYGMHHCANVVCGPEGVGWAVLLRALEPVAGVAAMTAARGATCRRPEDVANGPAKLVQAMGITAAHNGAALVADGHGPPSVTVVDDGWDASSDPVQTTRIGLSAGGDLPWRWYVPVSAHVSRR